MVEEIGKVLHGIAAEEEGFRLGDPWRYSDESVVAVLPVLRDLERERSYITFTEAGDILEVVETGHVNSARVKNNNGTAVFLRAGEILAGGTQERATVESTVVESGQQVEIPVVCIHQSRGLRTGAKFTPGGYTPRTVQETIYRNYYGSGGLTARTSWSARHARASSAQGSTWEGIRGLTENYSARLAARRGEIESEQPLGAAEVTSRRPADIAPPADDLVSAVGRYTQAIGDVISKVPYVENQVGLATIGMEGIQACELYDLRQSWAAVRESAVKQQGEDLSKVMSDLDQVFRYDPENAGRVFRALLTTAFETEKTGGNESWSTHSLRSQHYIGDITFINGELLHLYLVRKTD